MGRPRVVRFCGQDPRLRSPFTLRPRHSVTISTLFQSILFIINVRYRSETSRPTKVMCFKL